jgi:hypothetical protein
VPESQSTTTTGDNGLGIGVLVNVGVFVIVGVLVMVGVLVAVRVGEGVQGGPPHDTIAPSNSGSNSVDSVLRK